MEEGWALYLPAADTAVARLSLAPWNQSDNADGPKD